MVGECTVYWSLSVTGTLAIDWYHSPTGSLSLHCHHDRHVSKRANKLMSWLLVCKTSTSSLFVCFLRRRPQ